MQLIGAIIFLIAVAIHAQDLREKSASFHYKETSEIFYLYKPKEPRGRLNAYGNIAVGAGYSSDSQQVAPQVCFNATVSSTSAQQGYLQLDTAISFSELESQLGISVSVSGRYGMFSADAKAHYMRSLQDKEYATSLNYYEYTMNNVAVQLAGYGEHALTESGKQFYEGGKNPYFGLLCGDQYISSYAQGALLIMALNIKFSSAYAKQQFDVEVGASFADIVNTAETVKSTVTKYKLSGTVVIQAFQQGGEPSQLSKILSKDSSGHYYSLSCSLLAMDNCIKAAGGLLDYAKDEFSKQFSFQNNTGLTPLGISFTKYYPVQYIGLNPPVSLVTQKVKQYRNDLAGKLKENLYYQQKLYPFLNRGYPVQLDSEFMKQINSLLRKANKNVAFLMDQHGGAGDCFNYPDKCENIKTNIYSQLKNITINDLKYFDSMKYTIETMGGLFYNTGGQQANSWSVVPFNEPGKIEIEVFQIYATNNEYTYSTIVHRTLPSSEKHDYVYVYTGHGTYIPTLYKGTLCEKGHGCLENVIEQKLISPFFFEPYRAEHSK